MASADTGTPLIDGPELDEALPPTWCVVACEQGCSETWTVDTAEFAPPLTVRDEDRDGITLHLAEIHECDKDALIVCLAALIPLDQPAANLLAWVTWDENGLPVRRAS